MILKINFKIFQNKTDVFLALLTKKQTQSTKMNTSKKKKPLKTQDIKIIRNKYYKLYYPHMLNNPQRIIQSTKYCNSSKLKHKELCDYF